MTGNHKRILIFLLGTLGDTVVALPALHLVARRFPSAERRILTEGDSHPKAASMASLLEGSGLIHDYYSFPAPSKHKSRVRQMLALARQIRAWKPDTLVYLHEQRGQRVAWRDALIFRLLGIRHAFGIPLTRKLQHAVLHDETARFEHRAEYLARTLASLGELKLSDRSSWDLRLSAAEGERASAELEPLATCAGVLAMSIGTKVEVKDWGDENWRALLKDLSARLPRWGLAALGAKVEYERSSELLTAWHGRSVNLCGRLSIRESAAVLQRARLFVGHDSGPTHLAAAVGTPCAAIFSARSLPGRWFPYGHEHTVFYKKTECAGCQLDVCVEFKKKCLTAITVREVSDAVTGMLSVRPPVSKACDGDLRKS